MAWHCARLKLCPSQTSSPFISEQLFNPQNVVVGGEKMWLKRKKGVSDAIISLTDLSLRLSATAKSLSACRGGSHRSSQPPDDLSYLMAVSEISWFAEISDLHEFSRSLVSLFHLRGNETGEKEQELHVREHCTHHRHLLYSTDFGKNRWRVSNDEVMDQNW